MSLAVEDAYSRIPRRCLRRLARTKMPGADWALLAYILSRVSMEGEVVPIGTVEFVSSSGLTPRSVWAALNRLEQTGIIVRDRASRLHQYGLNTNPDDWEGSLRRST